NPDGTPRFAERKIIELEVAYPDHERDVHGLLRRYTKSRLATAGGDAAARQAADFVTLLLKKRLFSSPAAFAQTLRTHIATLASQAEAARSGKAIQVALERLDE